MPRMREKRYAVVTNEQGKTQKVELVTGLYAKKTGFFEAHFKEGEKCKRVQFPLTLKGYKEAKKQLTEHKRRIASFKSLHGDNFRMIDETERAGLIEYRNIQDELLEENRTVTLAEIVAFWKEKNMPKYRITFGELVQKYNDNKTAEFTVSGREEYNYKRELATNKETLRFIDAQEMIATFSQSEAENVKQKLLSYKKRNGKSYTAETINNRLSDFKKIFQFAVNQGFIDKNPFSAVKRFKIGKAECPILTPEEAISILQFMTRKNNISLLPAFVIALFEGVRKAEISRLLYSDIFAQTPKGIKPKEEVRMTADKTKTKITRIFPLSDASKDILQAWCNLQQKLGNPIDLDAFIVRGNDNIQRRRIYDNLITRMREKFKTAKNILRHTAATYKVELYQNVERVAKELGNSVEKIYSNYYQLSSAKEGAKSAAERFYSIRAKDVFKSE